MRALLSLLLLLTLTASAADRPTHTRRWYARRIHKLQKQHMKRTEHRANKVNRCYF